MLRAKQILAGVLIGMLISVPIHLYANNIKMKVEAWITPYVQFTFDNESKQLPLGYTVLNYENRTYVPARFIAEELGADVKWDEATQTVKITSKNVSETPIPEPPPEPEEENGDTGNEQEKIDYRALPMTKYYKEITVALTALNRDENDNVTRAYIVVNNEQSRPLQLKQMTAELSAGGKIYKVEDSPASRWDDRWFNDIRLDQEMSGFLSFPLLPEDIDKATIKFDLIYNDGTNEKHEIEYNIKL